MDKELEELQASVMGNMRVDLGAEEGDEAFDRHVLLAARIHRAAGLAQTVTGEGSGWIQFFTTYFPAERNSADDARLLWKAWRIGLLKNGTPLDGVAITHGQQDLHWQRDEHGALVVDLESMWDDYEIAVRNLIEELTKNPELRAQVIRRWCERSWTVRPFGHIQSPVSNRDKPAVTAYLPVGSTMAANSVTAWNPPDQETR